MVHETEIPLVLIWRVREKANRFLVQELRNHNVEGLAPSHGDILWALFKNRSLSMKQLAEIIDRDKSTVTALVNKLIKLGYVRKTPDATDSRVLRITLTKKGEGLQDTLVDISGRLLEKFYKNLSEKERNDLAALLVKINDGW